jgi:hypothetical protein
LAETPEAVLTPDVVETQRLGTLSFFDGMPDEDGVRKAYDNLDFMRGVEAFLSGMPAASIYAMCHGFEKAGIPAHTVGISEDLLDARSLWLTANSTTVYVSTCLDLKQEPVPMNNFWSFVVYSTQHRSMLETDQRLAGLDSTLPGVKPNKDGSYTIWFGPEAPDGQEDHWVQTMPGKGIAVILRLYGPLEPWFDKSWKPGDLELVK